MSHFCFAPGAVPQWCPASFPASHPWPSYRRSGFNSPDESPECSITKCTTNTEKNALETLFSETISTGPVTTGRNSVSHRKYFRGSIIKLPEKNIFVPVALCHPKARGCLCFDYHFLLKMSKICSRTTHVFFVLIILVGVLTRSSKTELLREKPTRKINATH